MSFDLTDEDDGHMHRYIEQVLQGYASGGMSLRAAQSDLAYALVSAAVDDAPAFKRYIRLSPEERARV
jgi:hypothetical protein